MSEILVGFGRADLWGSWQTPLPLADEIEVRSIAAGGPESACFLLTADVCGMWPSTCRRLRQAVSAAVAVPADQVGIYCTQNHGAPMEGPGIYDLDHWERAFVGAALMARDAAQPAHMAVVETVPSPPGVFKRRKPFTDMGDFSFYYGFENRGPGSAGCTLLLEQALHGRLTGPERTVRSPAVTTEWPQPSVALPHVSADAALDAADDPLLQRLFFRPPEGEPIGSLSRWAAHPVTANAVGRGHSGDYPVYIRRRLVEEFGGGALFLTGPCGNQAPLVGEKSRELAEEVGRRVAGYLLDALPRATWQSIDRAQGESLDVVLPVRDDYPSSAAEAAAALETARRRLEGERGSQSPSLPELKRLSEEIERLDYTVSGVHYRWCGLRPEELSGTGISHPLFAMHIGSAVIAGLPGEPFGSYSRELRRRLPRAPLLVTEEANGYLSYIPGAADYPKGGYGAAAAILAPEAEEILLDEMTTWIGGRTGDDARRHPEGRRSDQVTK